jgi:hypothetical protein
MMQDILSRTILVSAVLLFCSAGGSAQQAQNSNAPSAAVQKNPQTEARDLTIQGCVTGQERYTFMQASTGAMFGLVGPDSEFAAARGKLAEITGRELPPKAEDPFGRTAATTGYARADYCRSMSSAGQRCSRMEQNSTATCARTLARDSPLSADGSA